MDVPAPAPNQRDGYLVVLKPEAAERHFESMALVQQVVPGTAAAKRYRGIARDPIDRWYEGEAKWNRDAGPNDLARLKIWELYGPDPNDHWTLADWFDPDLLANLADAQAVLALTQPPGDFEIIQVTRGDAATTAATLGFDVGYWGSDHFSLIADVLVFCRWHSCPTANLPTLAPWASRLNEHFLFASASDAAAYRTWYMEQDWAEVESHEGQFQVIRIDLPAP